MNACMLFVLLSSRSNNFFYLSRNCLLRAKKKLAGGSRTGPGQTGRGKKQRDSQMSLLLDQGAGNFQTAI